MAKRICPKYDSSNTVGISNGYPSEKAFLLAEQGKIMLGGYCLTESNPEFHCKN
ncbi:MAG: hypothetical protein JJE17_04435 [Peptostreptococcaceae bacterium]|nr:hypothetical protein [Peptostreptococcaceae bacterium]